MADWRSDDRELLARILTAEAGNQGPIGMTAAGNVIMNRANTTGYGGDVRGVIMKPGQFSPMNSVTGYARGEQGQNIDALRPSETAYMVADSLLQGTAGDITGGATHFFNPDISNPSWAQGKEFTRIGDHVFGQADAGRGTTQNTGATAMRQPTMTQGQPAQMPQEQQQPGGLRGLLSDPDFYDRLAIGLGGLTMNPNQALMQMSADRIAGRAQTRQDTAAKNKTIEFLRSQPNGEQFVQLVDAIGPVAALKAYQDSAKGPDQTALMQNYEYALRQGMSPEEARKWVSSGTNLSVNTASEVGTIPQGYELFTDEATGARSLRPLRGGPAEAEALSVGAKDEMRAGLAEASSDIVITAAQRAREAADARRVGGILGPLAAMNPATANAEIVRQVGTLQSMAAAENINAMRQASPTGGALGNASDADIMLLKQKSGALDPFSPNFERDLEDYERTLLRTIHGFEAGNLIYDQTRGGLTAPTTTGNTINGVTVGEPY